LYGERTTELWDWVGTLGNYWKACQLEKALVTIEPREGRDTRETTD